MKVAVIGAYGSAGVAVAEGLVDEEDVELSLFDGGEPGGGLCILRGCMPSKEVLSAAAHRHQARVDGRLDGAAHEFDLEEVVERKDDHTLGFAEHRREAVHAMAERDDVEFVRETARIVDDTTVEAGGEEYDADRIVVATGSTPKVPDTPGMDEVDYTTSAEVLNARSFGDTGVVMGFGTVGLEMAPYLAEAGVDLTVIEHDDAPLDYADEGFGRDILGIYRDEFGVEIRTNVYEERLEPAGDGVRLHLDDGSSVEADELFVFTGRVPTVDGLGLENAGVEPHGDWVDGTLRARENQRVYAVGDVNGCEPILHVAKEEGYHAAENIVAEVEGKTPRRYETTKHRVTFTGAGVYPFARLGMTEEEARESGSDYVVAEREAKNDGVFKTKDVAHGRAKLVVDADDGRVLGWQALHYHADAMAKTMQVVVELGLDVRDLPHRAYHPTTPEILDGLFRETAEKVRES